jgi:predicted glycosyltransferase
MSKKVLVAPLDWGLGHATRCIPVIRELIKQNFKVVLGSTPQTQRVLQEEFSNLDKIELVPYNIQYSEFLPVWLTVVKDYKRLNEATQKEKEKINEIVKNHKINIIISDNRYGCFSSETKNILITHQLKIKSPLLENKGNQILRQRLLAFDEIWVPDNEEKENNLSGELSHGKFEGLKLKYVGALSRLAEKENIKEKEFEVCFVLSGVEPKRTQFEKECINFINSSDKKIAIVRGTKNKQTTSITNKNCVVKDFPDSAELQEIITSSKKVVCRSGYSSVMDLALMKSPAYFIPTPGQTEQEYLANYLDGKFGFKKISSLRQIEILDDLKLEVPFINHNKLKEAISSLA